MAINAPPLRRSLQEFQEFQRVATQVIGDGSRVRVSDTGIGLGYWQPWTPAYVDLTIGNGTVVSRYVQIGKWFQARFEWTWGSTSSWDSTSATITLPLTLRADGYADTNPIGNANFRDAATNSYPGWAEVDSGKVALRAQDASGAHTVMAAVSSTVPFTWTTSDILAWTVTGEIA